MSHLAPGGGSEALRRKNSRIARLLGAAILISLTAGIFMVRHCDSGAPQADAERIGAAALWRALGGDIGAFDEAERAFARASKAVVVDVFPTFALELTRRLRDGRTDALSPGLMPVVEALKRRDIPAAKRALMTTQSAPAHPLTTRLVNALDDARSASGESP